MSAGRASVQVKVLTGHGSRSTRCSVSAGECRERGAASATFFFAANASRRSLSSLRSLQLYTLCPALVHSTAGARATMPTDDAACAFAFRLSLSLARFSAHSARPPHRSGPRGPHLVLRPVQRRRIRVQVRPTPPNAPTLEASPVLADPAWSRPQARPVAATDAQTQYVSPESPYL